MKIKAYQLQTRGLNPAPNQIGIWINKKRYGYRIFQSYEKIIVLEKIDYDTGVVKTYLDERYWDYSRTTVFYRNQFLDMTSSEIKDRIKNSSIKLIDLNNSELY